MLTKPLLAALLLLTACGPMPADRAKAVALQKLPRLVGGGFLPASLRVYSFPAVKANKYLLGEQTGQDFELVTYKCLVSRNPLSSIIDLPTFAALVDRNDSLTLFVPDQRREEFARNYGVEYR